MNTAPEELRGRSKRFAVRIMRVCDALPRSISAKAVANQLVRSGMSVGANYRSACRARSKPEFIARLGIVVEEIDETQYWLELLVESNAVRASRLQPLMREAGELAAIFTASQRTARQNAKK